MVTLLKLKIDRCKEKEMFHNFVAIYFSLPGSPPPPQYPNLYFVILYN